MIYKIPVFFFSNYQASRKEVQLEREPLPLAYQAESFCSREVFPGISGQAWRLPPHLKAALTGHLSPEKCFYSAGAARRLPPGLSIPQPNKRLHKKTSFRLEYK